MSAQYGIAKLVFGTDTGKVMFAAITDGERIDYLPAPDGELNGFDFEDEIEGNTRYVLDGRIDQHKTMNPDANSPEDYLTAIGYNMPVSIEPSTAYDTWDEAYAAAQDALTNTQETVA